MRSLTKSTKILGFHIEDSLFFDKSKVYFPVSMGSKFVTHSPSHSWHKSSNHCIKISTAVNSYKVIQNIDNSSKIIFISWPHPTLWWTECSETPLINYEGRPCRHGASQRNEELGRSGERGRRDVIIIIMSLILTLLTPVKHTPTLQTYKLGNKSPSIMNSFCKFWELS